VRAPRHAPGVKKVPMPSDVEALLREIQRYLAYVEAFRTADSRPPPTERKGRKDS
jgi:hypothetical protein